MSPVLRRAALDLSSGGQQGQSLVEFSFALILFLLLLMGIVDIGRAVYSLTGTAQAAAEIARVTSVHPGAPLGASTQTVEVVGVQTRLVPGLAVTSYQCLDVAGSPVAGNCTPGNWVRVNVASSFHAVMPLLTAFGPINLTSSSSAEIE